MLSFPQGIEWRVLSLSRHNSDDRDNGPKLRSDLLSSNALYEICSVILNFEGAVNSLRLVP